MRKALGNSVEEEHKEGTSQIAALLEGDVGLLFTDEEPKVVTEWFETFKVPDYARAGNIATDDFVIPEGSFLAAKSIARTRLSKCGWMDSACSSCPY